MGLKLHNYQLKSDCYYRIAITFAFINTKVTVQTIKNQIPNLLTLSNLFCGCLAIKYAFEWDLVMAAYLVGLAAVFDFFDGFAARLLKVSGEMGKQLDSLADMVSFGVVPGVVMFQVLKLSSFIHVFRYNENIYEALDSLTYVAFLIPVFSAYRLAKFNIDTRQTDKFIGLPTPANAIFFCSLGLLFYQANDLQIIAKTIFQVEVFSFKTERILIDTVSGMNFMQEILIFPTILAAVTVLFSILLISELPLFALKFKNFGWPDNKIRYVFLTISLAMLIIFQIMAIPFIVILYILLSILNNLIFKQ
jgi:CDP-diacylglycerol--serine O-phosphatidyltransferase